MLQRITTYPGAQVTGVDFLGVLSQFGPLGLVLIYFIRRDDAAEKRRSGVEIQRVVAERERAESDKALSSALTALTVTIQHLEQRVK